MQNPIRKLLLPGVTAAAIAFGAMAYQADTQKAEAAAILETGRRCSSRRCRASCR